MCDLTHLIPGVMHSIKIIQGYDFTNRFARRLVVSCLWSPNHSSYACALSSFLGGLISILPVCLFVCNACLLCSYCMYVFHSLETPPLVTVRSESVHHGNTTIFWILPVDETGRALKVAAQFELEGRGFWQSFEVRPPRSWYSLLGVKLSTTVHYKLRAVNNCGVSGPVTVGTTRTLKHRPVSSSI